MSKYRNLLKPGWWNGQTPGFPRLPLKEQMAIHRRDWKARKREQNKRDRRPK